MISFFKNRRAETLSETIIALSILAIGITASSAVIASSMQNMGLAKNRIVAVNMAREGIEAVRSIRDTNWLKFSGKRRLCWNFMPKDEVNTDCNGDASELIAPGEYIVYTDEGYRKRLAPSHLNIGGTDTDLTTLSQVDISPTSDTNGDGNPANDEDMYNHIITHADIVNEDALGNANAKSSVFKRKIAIEYLKNDGSKISILTAWNILDDDTEKPAINRIRITSTVTWVQNQVEHKVELATHLTDYLGRDNLQN